MNTASSSRDARVRVVVATTVLLTFISFWRAAAIVLADLGSTAFYVGGIVEQAVGKSAPWFILGVMVFSYAVRALYIESSAMFVRGGVYRVVKEAMGGTLAKLSVSALLFDYVLTGPISGVSAGAYIVGLANDILVRSHVNAQLPSGATAAFIAILITIYFWWRNTKGMHESSDDALKIMQVATVMVVVLIAWCTVTLVHRGGSLPPAPTLANLKFSDDALGWLKGTIWPSFTAIAILVGFGHSILAMSGEESLAQVYREIEHPKVKNLQRAGMVIFIYSLVFTALVSFFAVAIIPDGVRAQYYDNLISGLAMNVVGPVTLRLVFQGLVVVVGFLMLAGAVNTAIVGSNGVLNRVSEDGVLTDWFRKPHKKFGTTYRLINLIVLLQIATIIISGGNVIVLGEAYAFGVVWSFAFNALAVTVLRYKLPDIERGWKVPFNLKVGGRELPFGLMVIAVSLFSAAFINLFTKRTATISGLIFTLGFFAIFVISERITMRRRAANSGKLDQFQLNTEAEVDGASLRCRPGGVLVPVRDYNTLAQLEWAVENTAIDRDIVVLTVRLLRSGAGGGSLELNPDELFTDYEQHLFTRVVAIAERHGRGVILLTLPATNIFDAVAQTAANLKVSEVIVGESAAISAADQAHMMGDAWDRTAREGDVATTFVILSPNGETKRYSLGAHAPNLSAEEVERIHKLWLMAVKEIGPGIHHHDVVATALSCFEEELASKRPVAVDRLRRHANAGTEGLRMARQLARAALALGSVAAVTVVYAHVIHITNSTIVALTMLLIVLVAASTSALWVSVTTSLGAVMAINFFFLPPVGSLSISDPENWVALFTFLAVSLVASNLSSAVRARELEALERRDEMARLFDLSRDVLLMTDSREAISGLSGVIARRFGLEFVAVCLPKGGGWDIFGAGPGPLELDRRKLSETFADAERSLAETDPPRFAGHRTYEAGSPARTVRLVPLRMGVRPVGIIAASGRPVEPGTLAALGGVVAIAIERGQLLEARTEAELSRRSEELKSALLASLGHDLRTPLTAIRVAASNLQASWLTPEERLEQNDIVLEEVERLTRLFQNILDMARIDSGAVSADVRRVHPSEIVGAARDLVPQALRSHPVDARLECDVLVKADPRLTAAALSHLLENAAQYSAPGTPIEIATTVDGESVRITVRDHGPGIPAADLPHLFDRFYRGGNGKKRSAGTGMGLSIARGLVAAEHGRIWAENVPEGGAMFTVALAAASERLDAELVDADA